MDGSFQRVSPGQIEKAVAPYAHAGFLSTDLDAVEDAVEALPWVDRARVQRRWPNSLHVTVVEQTAAARWGDSGLLEHPRRAVRASRHPCARGAAAPVGTRRDRVAGRAALSLGARSDARGGHAHRGAAARRARRLGDGLGQRRHGAPRAPRRRRAHRPVHPHRLAGHRAPHERDHLRGHALFERLRHRLAQCRSHSGDGPIQASDDSEA